MTKGGFVYILTTVKNTALYVGITNNLEVRNYKHKTKYYPNSFTKKYNIDKLVYFEHYDNIEDAIRREKQIKGWLRVKKIELIRNLNPDFKDLIETME